MSKNYGEVKVRKNFFPSDARKLIEKGNVKFLITQAKITDTTKKLLRDGGVTAYHGINPDDVTQLLKDLN